ncbi:phage tail protein [Methylobacterium platani]|uniref:Phage tail collar domain-containing protein n=2 Tax=Methylobacterium platani TaxID=427683 RepID=A0A179SHI5_9HYPH|nr:tail fiber protein [Methylobacterium platani]KMO15110.1 hypothetical protein SQ03_17800 [Methylobacterium platani JCM 14648]OAS26909.1 hypothetical protein A5481_02760 [Methylobacterium platani]
MTDFYLGQIIMFAGPYEPTNWKYCAGQILQIQQYNALYGVLGTTYGGDGRITFALPDLRSRVPVGTGQSPGLSAYRLGATGGVETVTLTPQQMPAHNHTTALSAFNGPGTTNIPTNAVLAQPNDGTGVNINAYAQAAPNVTMSQSVSGVAGSGLPHANIQPYQVMNYIICVNGLFPMRN